MKNCELCNSLAKINCESDQASLCWDCDSKVHGANFLVAKHSRILLCHVCQSPTPWTGSGPKLGPTVSICDHCVNNSNCREERGNEESHDDDGDDDHDNDSDDDDDDTDSDGGGDGDEDDEENQVVPLSSTPPPPPPPVDSSSASEEDISDFNMVFPMKRMRDKVLTSHDHMGGTFRPLQYHKRTGNAEAESRFKTVINSMRDS